MTDSARTEEIRARVELMADPKQEKWDLSPNDQAALRDLLTELTALREEVKRLKGLVGTMWLHAGYQDCGYLQMTSAQKVLYNEIIERSDKDAAERYGFSAVEQLAALSPSPAQQEAQ